MPRGKQGLKAGRVERHRAYDRQLKARKRLRRQRAEVHAAMQEAERRRKAGKKGPAQFDRFMREQGFEPRIAHVAERTFLGREVPGDVLDKYERVS